jgi:hypothetical protein
MIEPCFIEELVISLHHENLPHKVQRVIIFFFLEKKYNLLINSDLETLRQDHMYLYVPPTLRWQM